MNVNDSLDGPTMNPEVEIFLAHHGVKGMHWGSHRSPAEHASRLDAKITKVSSTVNSHETAIKNIKSHIKDANNNGTTSELFKSKYGSIPSGTAFKLVHGMSKGEALDKHKGELQDALDNSESSRQINQIRLTHLQKKRARISG